MVGIIAEYNPLHNGHKYLIDEAKKLFKNQTIICVLSGNFTQRGDVSIIDKFKRSQEAINAGCDLVIELPFPFATQSADYFAKGALSLLNHLKVENLVFGSEANDINTLIEIASIQNNNDNFNTLVGIYSKQGYNYPTALSLAIKDLTNKVIDTPNDLLGISYIKEILKNNYNIKPTIIKRTSNYHSYELKETSSATAIRNAIINNVNIEKEVPKFTLKDINNIHKIEDYFNILKYKIITEKDLSIYQTVDEGIDKLLKKNITKATSYKELIQLTKSKRYTYNKICRMLLHILCNFTKEKANEFNKITYIRPLAFNNKGKIYLNKIKKELSIPIISKITKEKDKMLEYELSTTLIYDLGNESTYYKEIHNNPYKKDAN